MNHQDMLARLIAQAAAEGGDLVTLRAVVEEASELGANRVLGRLGLADAGAEKDIDELRELLAAWRAAKASAWKAVVAWLVRAAFALLLIGLAVRLGLPETLADYELSFEDGEKLRGRFLVQRLDYAGDFNGERTYMLQLESSGAVVPA